MDVVEPEQLAGIPMVGGAMQACDQQSVGIRSGTAVGTGGRQGDRAAGDVVVGEDGCNHLPVGDSPVEIERVLDPKAVRARQGRL